MMKRITLYAALSDDELDLLDDFVYLLDYDTRTDLVTALIHAVLYGTENRTKTKELTSVFPCYSKLQRMKTTLFDFLDETAIPVLAKHGAEKTTDLIGEELKTHLFKHCGTTPGNEDLHKWVKTYTSMNKSRIIEYRMDLTTEHYREEQEAA